MSLADLTPLERVQAMVDDYAQEEDEYHRQLIEQDPTWAELLPELQRWATAAFHSARTLREGDGIASIRIGGLDVDLGVDEWQRLLKNEPAGRVLEQRIADEGAERMWAAKSRISHLLSSLASARMSARAEDYLFRVGQLYLWGFDEQVFSMARATLEAALADRYDNDQVWTRLGEAASSKVRRYSPSLDQRIRALEAKPRLADDESVEDMDRIKQAGNHTLHVAATAYAGFRDAGELLRALARVLRTLYPEDAA